MEEGLHGRPRCKWYLKETGCDNIDWIHLDHGSDQWRALVITLMKLGVP